MLSMKTKMLYIIGVLFLLCGCTVEYVYDTTLYIKNNSTHDIEIIVEEPSSEVMYYGSVTVKSGEIVKKGKSTEGGFMPPAPFKVQIKFDDGTAITHQETDGDAYHNFCSKTAFEKKLLKKRMVEYTFVFTNADYEYAVQHANVTE